MIAIHGADRHAIIGSNLDMQRRLTADGFDAERRGAAAGLLCLGIFEQYTDVGAIHALAGGAPDQAVFGAQAERGEAMIAERPQLRLVSSGIVYQHRALVRAYE